jgi:hypothetical protein
LPPPSLPFFSYPLPVDLPQFKVASTTHLGFPSWLREVRSGSDLKVATDRVVQALLRTTCQDGFKAGYEAGLRAASGKKTEAKASTTRERLLKEELRTCSEVPKIKNSWPYLEKNIFLV